MLSIRKPARGAARILLPESGETLLGMLGVDLVRRGPPGGSQATWIGGAEKTRDAHRNSVLKPVLGDARGSNFKDVVWKETGTRATKTGDRPARDHDSSRLGLGGGFTGPASFHRATRSNWG